MGKYVPPDIERLILDVDAFDREIVIMRRKLRLGLLEPGDAKNLVRGIIDRQRAERQLIIYATNLNLKEQDTVLKQLYELERQRAAHPDLPLPVKPRK